MKLALSLILSLLVTGCAAWHKTPKTSPLGAAATSSISTIQQHHDATKAKLVAAAEKQDQQIQALRERAPTLIDIADAMSENNNTVRECANELETEGTDLAAAKSSVDALTKENATLRAQVAKLQSNSKFLSGLDWFSLVCIGAFVAGIVLIFALPEMKPLSIGLIVGGIAGASVCRLYRQADELWFWAGCGLLLIIFAVLVYVVIKAVRDRNAKTKALKQVTTGAEIVTQTLAAVSPPQAALATLQLKSVQDQDTSRTVDAVRAGINKDMVKGEVAKAAVISALTPTIPPSPLPPPALSGLVGADPAAGQATVAVTGPTVEPSG